MATYNNEDMRGETVSASAVNIKAGGMKAIVYLDASFIDRIIEQIKVNNGQLNQTTAMAIASSVAAAVKYRYDQNWKEIRAVEHKPSDPNYDVEESDDPRTVFNWDGDGDE